MKDILGREIKVGDIVAHGQRYGNGGGVSVKVVADLRDDEVMVKGYSERKFRKGDDGEYAYFDEFTLAKGGWTDGDRMVVLTEAVSDELRNKLRDAIK